ncbi:MAG: hypothetical protein ACLFP2_05375 [Candidatus Woesearchaeota archaeon]
MKKLFGIPFAALVVVVLVIGGATAALVSYLSNTVSADTSVTSPIETWFNDGGEKEYTIDLDDAKGGDGVSFRVYSKNNANQDVDSYPVFIISGPDGTTWTGEEFTSVLYGDKDNYADSEDYIEILDKLYHVKYDGSLVKLTELDTNPSTLRLFFNKDDGEPYTQAAGSQKWNQLVITLNSAIKPGDYSFEHCHLYELTGTCQDPGEPSS